MILHYNSGMVMLVLMVINILLVVGVVLTTTISFLRARKWLFAFITPKKEGEASDFGLVVGQLSKMITADITQSMTGQSLAEASHITRQENAIRADMAGDMIANGNPLVSLLIEQFPSVKRRLAKNPTSMVALANMISKGELGSLLGGGKRSGNGRNTFATSLQKFE